jgi:hypothetical protein
MKFETLQGLLRLLALVALLGVFALSGCSWVRHMKPSPSCNKPQPYQSERSVPPLHVPPGIDAPDTKGALKLPELNEPEPPPRTVRDPCLDEPPSFSTPGARRTPST